MVLYPKGSVLFTRSISSSNGYIALVFNVKIFQKTGNGKEVKPYDFLSYVEERLWWPTHSPNKGRKKKAKKAKRRERSGQLY